MQDSYPRISVEQVSEPRFLREENTSFSLQFYAVPHSTGKYCASARTSDPLYLGLSQDV
jgi:hypothetical protein